MSEKKYTDEEIMEMPYDKAMAALRTMSKEELEKRLEEIIKRGNEMEKVGEDPKIVRKVIRYYNEIGRVLRGW
jgi:chaperonin cofactor prefoldin